MANRAGVVVNVLNPAGTPLNPMVEGFPGLESIVQVAKQTGGSWLLATPGPDLTTDLNEVMEDLSGYYLLGYHPDHRDDVRRKIEVKVLRPGLIVRARNGAMGTPELTKAAGPPKGREDVMRDALFSVFTADGIRVHLDPVFAAAPPDPKTNKRAPVIRTRFDIDGRDLTLLDADKDNKKLVLDLAVAVFNADGSQAGAKNMTFTINMAAEKAASLAATGLQYKMDVKLAGPGPYQVRAAVRDQPSGKIGTAYSFLNIPDIGHRRISLSGMVLSDAGGGARASWNEFAQGSAIRFACEAFGLKPGTPNVDVEVRFYRGGEPVVDIPPAPLRIESQGDRSFLAGSVNVSTGLAVGNYAMEIIAYDRTAPQRKQAAEQWADVTVVN